MDINVYFGQNDSENSPADLRLCNGRCFNEKIKDFYTGCIEGELKRIQPDIKKWDEFLFKYINLDLPIYWIRKYESSGDKFNNKNNNRRSCLTLVVDNNTNTVKFAYAFVSNYDAQELYNMIRNGVDAPNEKDFLEMLQKGEYQFHYQEDGKDCQDNLVSYFDKRGNIKGGVLNLQNWYLAHINGVNDIPYENKYHLSNAQINELFFPKGHVNDWVQVPLEDFENFEFNRNKTNTNLDRRVRIIDINDIYKDFRQLEPDAPNDEIDDLYKNLLKAHFLRFVHPINYFLVPSKKCEVNYIFGRKNVSIGEYGHLIEYIKNKRKNIFSNSIIKKAEDNMMLPTVGISKMDYGSEKIYISYGNAYIDYSFLNDEQKVQAPAGYNTLEDFIKKVNSGNGNQYNLIIYYSVSNKEYQIAYSPKKQISQLGIKSKIVIDIKKNLGRNIDMRLLDYIRIDIDNSKTSSNSGSPKKSKNSKNNTNCSKQRKYGSKDHTIYQLDGVTIGKKTKLPAEIIKKAIKDHKISDYKELVNTFIDVGMKKSNFKESGKIKDNSRWISYDCFDLNGVKFAVTNQWTKDKIRGFIERSKKVFNYDIK